MKAKGVKEFFESTKKHELENACQGDGGSQRENGGWHDRGKKKGLQKTLTPKSSTVSQPKKERNDLYEQQGKKKKELNGRDARRKRGPNNGEKSRKKVTTLGKSI